MVEAEDVTTANTTANPAPAALPEGPPLIYAAIPDEIAARIGQIVTRHTLLQHKMIDVYRAILRLETHDAAALAYAAMPSRRACMKTLRLALQQERGRDETSANFETIIDEFEAVSEVRDACEESVWWMDSLGRLWISRMDSATATLLNTEVFDISTFETTQDRISGLIDLIFSTTVPVLDSLERPETDLQVSDC